MLAIVLYTLLCVIVCLLVARSQIRRSRTALGLVLGLLPIGIMEAIYHFSLQASIRSCLESACLSASLPAACERIEFGCTEWSGLSVFLFWAAGAAALVLYGFGAMILVVAESRRPLMESPRLHPDPGEKAPPPD